MKPEAMRHDSGSCRVSELPKPTSKDSACSHLRRKTRALHNIWDNVTPPAASETGRQLHPTSSSLLSVDQVGRPAVMRKECCTLYLTTLGRTSDGTRSRTLPISTRGRFSRVLWPLRDRHRASCGGMGSRSAEDYRDTSISGIGWELSE